MNQQAEEESGLAGIAEQVSNFYDRFPYPQPVESLEKYRRLWLDRERRRTDFHLFWPAKPYREDYSILIAGCGTSQAAKHALRWPASQVTGIDFSLTSIKHTQKLKRKYGLSNLHIRQLPIERVSDLNMRFDKIVCTGVLHHMADPDAGLRALREVLKPDGAMHLMLYAPYGRTGIYMLQEFSRRVGIPASEEGIRDLIAALRALPPGHPLEYLLHEAPDFRHEAAIADALLHPQDRAYSVPQLFDFIHRGGMAFGRWIRQAPYSPHCGVMAGLPQTAGIAHLPSMEQYAAVELFRGTMVRHSVVLYRDDYPGDLPQIDFTGDLWSGYVPIRMADTICAEDRLPSGAAGVLINRNHSYTDLYLPINAMEKRFLDAINGSKTIKEIVESALGEPPGIAQLGLARAFFERLWFYDQVVFATNLKPNDSGRRRHN